MAKLVKTKVVAEEVIENLDLPPDISAEDLLDDVSVRIDPETAVLDIAFTDTDRERAVRVAQEMGAVFSALVRERFGTPSQPTTDAREVAELPVIVTIFDPAKADEYPVSPRPVRNLAVAAILGIVLGLLAALLREHFDRALRTREDVERAFGVPVIGQVPFQRMRRTDRRAVAWSDFSESAEAFRALRANLQYLGVKRPLHTIVVTSASPEQGKTTVAANLAIAIARSGASPIVIEGDLRRPRLAESFGLPDTGAGLTTLLVGLAQSDDVVQRVAMQRGDGSPGVAVPISVLPSGPLPPNPSELLSSFQMRDLLEQLRRSYEYVLIDAPPLLPVADTLELARMVDGVVLVVRRNRASTDEARELRAIVERLEIHLVGAVFTDVEPVGTYGAYAPDAGKRRSPAAAPPPEREPAASAAREDS
jgi:capsular exopolysaccharide synthesis family protein